MTKDELLDLLTESVIAAYGHAHGNGHISMCKLLSPAFNAVLADDPLKDSVSSPAKQLLGMRERFFRIQSISSTALEVELP